MSDPRKSDFSETVLVLAPVGRDGAATVEVLAEGGVPSIECADVADLVRRLDVPHGAVILTEAVITDSHLSLLQDALYAQPHWSDIPLIMISSSETVWSMELFARVGNISLLEKPISRLTLVRAIEVALRARRRQYRVRSILEEQILATQKRDEFFAALSHELRTPLNVILGWLDLLQEGKLDSEAQREALEIVVRNARAQQGLIDDLLDVSRIINNKMIFEGKPVALGPLLKSTVFGFLHRAKEKRLKVNLAVPAGDFMVLGDHGRMAQVISNMITNAIKFTPENGDIWIELSSESELYKITFQDNGQGIDSAFIPNIFDRLKQEDMTTTRNHGGLGLGLAITARIVELHGGTIEAESPGKGKGAKFTIRIPMLKSDERSASVETAEKAPLPQSLDGVKVLVVDDSHDNLELFEIWLTRAKAKVRLVLSAKEALDCLTEFRPDVLVSDIGMPEMDGYQLIAAIRKRPRENCGEIPALALTAYARQQEKLRALHAGYQLHITKPIEKDRLIAAILKLLGPQASTSQ